jgi:hypothetical protein
MGGISSSIVRDHRHRTDGATDAGEERASASGVTAGRCSVHRSVRIILSSEVENPNAPQGPLDTSSHPLQECRALYPEISRWRGDMTCPTMLNLWAKKLHCGSLLQFLRDQWRLAGHSQIEWPEESCSLLQVVDRVSLGIISANVPDDLPRAEWRLPSRRWE